MKKYKLYKKRIKFSLTNWLLLSSMLFSAFLSLIRPTLGDDWWNANWNFRKSITINHTMVNSTLVNFPILIDIIDPDLINKAQIDGDDIVFIGPSNTTLNHEIEHYNSSSGHLVAWVNIPTLSSTSDTQIYMYYGNPTATNQQNPTAVWDSNFVMVQHLEETSTSRLDSTAYRNNGTAYNGVSKTSGKIDGTDQFDGVNDYLQVSNSPSLNPTSAITIELWMNLSNTGNYINLVNKGTYRQYYLRLGITIGNAYWYVKFSDGSVATVSGSIGWTTNKWHHIVAALDTNARTIEVYLDGAKKLSGTFASGKTIIATTNSVRVSDTTRMVKGTVDEFRISNTARSAAYIQTSCNNQKDPSAFYSVGVEEVYSGAQQILVSSESPANGTTEAYTNPTLSIRALHLQEKAMNITFKEKVLNNWIEIQTYYNVLDGTYTAIPTKMTRLGTTYYWNVYITDGQEHVSKTFSLTTTTKILQQKWITYGTPKGASGVLITDINNDGIEEIIHAGIGGVIALKGTDGSVIWNISDTYVGEFAQSQIADLNKDGIPEVIVPLEGNSLTKTPAGLLVLHANNGSTYWRKTGLGLETYSSPVIFDIDGDEYPEIFFASTDVHKGVNGTGRITSLTYNGEILNQVFAWRPCGGGLSIADTNGDGEFELYMGDRYMYLNDAEYGDNDYGKGVQSYWARNLTLRWFRSDIFCSSQIPMIVDVDNDGTLDIVVGDMNGGVVVLNSNDGSTIRIYQGGLDTIPTHYQPSICDIDGDGNLEMLMADPHEDTHDPVSQWPSDDIVIWDLVNWKVDSRIYIGKSFYGPQLADVTGDGNIDIIVCNYRGLFIFDKDGRVLDGITGLTGRLNYAVAQDIDGDGYTEIVISSSRGRIYAYDTPARRPNQRARTEVQFYSEYRLGTAEYVQPQAGPAPLITSPSPPNLAQNIPVSLSTLNFTITDYQRNPMNITVTTNPNIGTANLTNTGNDRYTINISNLQYSTTYQWTISATDGTHWTNKTYTFTTQDFIPWWNTSWPYRKPITIDHTKTNTDLQDFPVLIDITDNDLKTKAQTNGQDITFTDSNGKKLDHEIEQYESSTGHLTAWVKIPILYSNTDTTLYMYYGNPTATNQQNPTAVWDSNFVMVQHLEETSTSRLDSTAYRNNGTAINGVTKSSKGKIDGADQLDGVNDYINFANNPTLNPSSAMTIEIWMNISLTGDFINLITKGDYSQYYLRLGSSQGATYWYAKFVDGTAAYVQGNIGWKTNTWHHLVATIDTNTQTIKVYLDGVEKLSGTFAAGKTLITTTKSLLISDITRRWVKGTIDEVRISNTARSASWILTSYNNQKDPTTFYSIGNEETIPEAPTVHAPYPSNKATDITPSITELSFNLTDCQNNPMNYTVTTYPNIGSTTGTNVNNGRFSVTISGLQYSATYNWTINVYDGTHWTNVTFTFKTYLTEPPTQNDPILLKSGNDIICYNQTTMDPDSDKITNIYQWTKNGISTTNLLMPFDTNNATAAKDYSGYNNNGMIIKDVTWTSEGKVGGAYSFNKGYIQIPGSNALDGGGTWSEITVEHWIYLTASQSNTRTIARIPSYEIRITSNKIFASIWTAPGNSMVSGHNQITYNTTLNLNTWYHVALTYKKGVAMTLYVNGSAVATKTPTESTTLNYNIQPSGSNPLYIGWFEYFKGKIDEIRLYPKSLSPQQILQRYLETKDGQSKSSTIVQQELQTGDTWQCKVTPNDSHQDGTTKTSNPITIGTNTKPSAKDLTITPPTPKTNDDLTGNYTFFDPDGDPENTTLTEIRWYKNDQLIPELNNTLTVPSSYTTRGEIWHFTVKPSDGTEFGDIYESPNVLIQNSPPQIDDYYPTETEITIYEGQTQTFNVTCSDIDNDTLTITWLIYYSNGTLKETTTGGNYTFIAETGSADTYTIIAKITDTQDETTHQWTLTVQQP